MDLVAEQPDVRTSPSAVPARPGADRTVLLVAAAAVLVAVLAVVAAATGGAARASALDDPGAITRWGLLLVRTAHDIAAMCTLGVLAVAVLLLPSGGGQLLPDAVRLLRVGSRWATAWVGSGLLVVVLTLSEATALPVRGVLTPDVLTLGLELPQTRALLSAAWLAALVAGWARYTRSSLGGVVLLLTAVGALLPPLVTGHAAHQEAHTTAVISLAVHVGAASLWVGGLLALALHLRRSPMALAVALPRYSRMALACFLAVGLSGLITGWAAFATPSQVWTTSYGRVMLAKLATLLVLGVLGYWHRRRSMPAMADGRGRAFLALAAAELVLMAGAAGLAVGLSHTPPPPSPSHGVSASAH